MDGIGCAVVTFAFVALFAIVFGFAVWADSATCSAKTRGMTIESRWDIFGGCQVQDPNAGWVPLENYRVM